MKHNLENIASQFQLDGRFLDAAPYGSGHINDTFVSRFQVNGGVVRYIHQRLNKSIFREPEKVMENVALVTRHAHEHILAAGGDPLRETLNLVPALDGKSYYLCPDGDCWRSLLFIEGARTYDQVEDLRHVYSASKAFGNFQKMMTKVPMELLHETIPHFHDTRKRFGAFVEVLEKDAFDRAGGVKAEIEFVARREAQMSVVVDMLADGRLSERVTHNDTKLNNVLIDDITGEGLCVIDLDTVMPGSVLYDFGDSVRIGASTAAEDERDLSKVGISMEMFDCLSHGYLDSARDFLTETEIAYLPFSAKLITLECGMRFLTDYLNGDKYFKTHREEHNLDRCRTQFKMVSEMEQQMEKMREIVDLYR